MNLVRTCVILVIRFYGFAKALFFLYLPHLCSTSSSVLGGSSTSVVGKVTYLIREEFALEPFFLSNY